MSDILVPASKEYTVHIERGAMAAAGGLARSVCGGKKALIVCGDTVRELHSGAVRAGFEEAGYETEVFSYPHGERSKNSGTYMDILSAMAAFGMSRADVTAALGGGVTGDLAGFAAATYMRGIRYVQIPTTLLAMIDSSVGGKTGIDLPAGKNLAGAFWQPSAVACDPDALDTLPEDIFRDGCAEAVKYAVLADPGLLALLKEPRRRGEEIIEKCVAIKRDFVCRDEFDSGERQKLNLGHTVGHAAEKLSGYTLSHGKAVAQGLAVISRAAAAHGDCSADTSSAVVSALERLGLPTRTEYSARALAEAMLNDKKRAGGTVNLIIPRKLGVCDIVPTPAEALEAYIEKGL